MARYIASLIVVGFLLFKHATYADPDPSIFGSLGDNSVWNAPVLSHIKAGVDTVSDKFQQFLAFMREYGKTYTSKEELEKRFHIFQENMKTVKELNAENKGRATFGITEFSDMTPEEFKRTRLGLKRKTEHKDDTN
ncbi:unnamed protein product [Bemisia tabaci]|uniref:Cathepsin propeptide inhibitor domain-containing protein n=1 Tax=Bemisia tabaci TaxID=7038 RepID=A0A9P0ABH7_BEMTA|nr:unnamed protein product [Bemisia tabaci]